MVVSSTEEFITRISDVVVNRDKITASLDIVSLFPCIDTQKVIRDIGTVINGLVNLDKKIKSSYKAKLNLIIFSNVFIFSSKF